MKMFFPFLLGKFFRAAALVLALLAAASCAEEKSTQDGGALLSVAYNAQPANYDPMLTASASVREITRLVFESLFELDAEGNPRPQLCETYTKSDDNREWSFTLREGVKFHNGEELTAEDAAASLNRWVRKFSVARRSIRGGEEFTAADKRTVKIKLKNPCILLPYMIAHYSQFAAILPASALTSAGESALRTEHLIGTGGFKFSEWAVDHYVRLDKFEGYRPPSQEASGSWGDRTARVDTVMIYFVQDTTTRLNGLETGEYDIAVSISYTDLERLKGMQGVSVMYSRWNGMIILLNKSSHSMFSRKIWREAVKAAIAPDEILEGAVPTSGGYRAYEPDGAYFPRGTVWYADIPVSPQNTERARTFLAEAGYDGEEPVVIVTSKSYPEWYNASLIVQQQLEAVGLKVDLQVFDWGTVLARLGDPSVYDLFPTSYPYAASPVSVQYLMKTDSSGYTDDAKLNEYVAHMQAKPTLEAAAAFWRETVQPYCDEEIFTLHLGGYDYIYGVSQRVKGFEPYYGLKLWGVSAGD
jgi:peptide/nickel transport system substrate-binding protein